MPAFFRAEIFLVTSSGVSKIVYFMSNCVFLQAVAVAADRKARVHHAARRRGPLACGAWWPKAKITLRQGVRVIHDSRRTQRPKRALIPYGPKPKTGSPSPDGGSAGPVRWGAAFFEARGCVDHLEFILGRGVLALVGHQADRCAARALPGLVHEQLQLLLAVCVKRTLWNELFAGIELIFSGIG